MTGSKLIDSSVWLSYFLKGDLKEVIEKDEVLLLSSISLFEIRKKLSKINIPKEDISKSIEFVKKRSLIIPLTAEIAEKAVDFSIENKLPMVDSLIYATAIINQAKLITLDNDFRGLKDIVMF